MKTIGLLLLAILMLGCKEEEPTITLTVDQLTEFYMMGWDCNERSSFGRTMDSTLFSVAAYKVIN